MVLKTLDVLGPLYVYGVARRIEQISGNLLAVSQGALYPVLLKWEQSRRSGAPRKTTARLVSIAGRGRT
jgi:hypothetical protein